MPDILLCTASVKKLGTFWNLWIFSNLRPPKIQKAASSTTWHGAEAKSRNPLTRPALRGVVTGRWALCDHLPLSSYWDRTPLIPAKQPEPGAKKYFSRNQNSLQKWKIRSPLGANFLFPPFAHKSCTAASCRRLLVHGCPAPNRLTQSRTGAARRDFAPCPTGHRSFLFSIDKVGPGFRPETASAAACGKPDALLAPPVGG